MRLIDRETRQEKAERRKRGGRSLLISAIALLISAIALPGAFQTEGGISHLLFVVGFFGIVLAGHFLFDGVCNLLLPNFSIAFVVLFAAALIAGLLVYLSYFAESGEA